MKRSSRTVKQFYVLISLLSLLTAGPALAAITQLSGPGGFVSSTTTVNFDGVPHGTPVNNLYAAQGVTFSRDDG